MSFFEELGLLDRPFVPVKLTLHGKQIELRARALSGRESDELEALQMDEYGVILAKLMDAKDGKISELERVTKVYTEQPKADVVKQLLAAREQDVNVRALEITGINFTEEAAKMESLPEDEREAYAKEQNELWEAARDQAKAELTDRFMTQPIEDLAKQVAQVTINIRALKLAKRMFNDTFLHYALYEKDEDKKVFASKSAVGDSFSADTIQTLVEAVQQALRTDLPFGSPAAPEQSKPSSSQDTSAEATEISGTPTTTTPES